MKAGRLPFDSLVCSHGHSKVQKRGGNGRRWGRSCVGGVGRCGCRAQELRLVVLKLFLVVKIVARRWADQVRILTCWDPLLDLEIKARDVDGGVDKRLP